jgi:hypothetical protein
MGSISSITHNKKEMGEILKHKSQASGLLLKKEKMFLGTTKR